MSIIKCPECNNEVSTSAEFCPHCGVRISGNIKKCPNCGMVVVKDEITCPMCKTSLRDIPLIGVGGSIARVKKKKSYILCVVIIIVMLLLVVGGAFAYLYYKDMKVARLEQKTYESVLSIKDTSVCNFYISKFPKGPHLKEVKVLLSKLNIQIKAWNDICYSNDKSGYLRFLKNYPSSVFERECLNKIDSLDFIDATTSNTMEAYQLYLSNHADGIYVKQARLAKERISELVVKPEEEMLIKNLCSTFFYSLSMSDNSSLITTVEEPMNNFLNKHNATRQDILDFAKKVRGKSMNNILFTVNEDYTINKVFLYGDSLMYNVSFSVNKIVNGEDIHEKFAVNVSVNTRMKMTSFGMKRLILATKKVNKKKK